MEEGWVWCRFWEKMWAERNKRDEMGRDSSITRVNTVSRHNAQSVDPT